MNNNNYQDKVEELIKEYPKRIIVDGEEVIVDIEFNNTGKSLIDNLFNLFEKTNPIIERN